MDNLHVKKLSLINFKGLKEISFDFDKRINVIIGINGSGKSSILFGLAMALSRFIGRMRSLKSNGILFDKNYIKNGASESSIEVDMIYNGKEISWHIGKQRYDLKQTITNLQNITNAVLEILGDLQINHNLSIPVVVFYGVGRNVLDVPLKIKKKHEFSQLAAYDEALLKERSTNDFRLFFEWYREREDLENEMLREENNYIDPQLNAVRSAIYSILPEFTNLRVKRNPLRMVLDKVNGSSKETLDINQLSDGEKCMLSMVGDLARRLSIANPSLENPLYGNGIVLIDEIDLHLHPQWEATIVEKLEKTFPKCQFIVTTHSPLVLSRLEPENIFVLNQDAENGVFWEHPDLSKGLTINEILEDTMNTANMSPEVQNELDCIYSDIEDEKWNDALDKINLLRQKVKKDFPELLKAATYLDLSQE